MKKALDANLDFDGMAGSGVNRSSNKHSGNYFGEHMKENYGMGPRKGNESDSPSHGGKSVTKDPKKMTIATASQGGKINGGATAKGFANPDKINVGNK